MASSSIPQYTSPEELRLLNWFHSSGGILSSKCAITHFQGMGRGFTARQEIQQDELLFSIPRHLLLNINTSQLSAICKESDQENMANKSSGSDIMMVDVRDENQSQPEPLTWDLIRTKGGWAGLILSMMFENWRVSESGRKDWESYNADRMTPWTSSSKEDADGHEESKSLRFREQERPKGNQEWGPYLDILPTKYDTPIFWNQEELRELEGTNVIDKVGRSEMDQTYQELVLPYIQSRPSIFLGSASDSTSREETIRRFYSLEMYHRMGSAILSRSFHVEKPGKEDKDGEHEENEDGENEDEDEEEGQEDEADATLEHEVEEDDEKERDDTQADAEVLEEPEEHEEESEEEEEGEDPDPDQEQLEDISMTPMADLLNAKYESDNVSTPRSAGLALFGGNPSRAVLELHRAEKDGGKEGRARLFYKALTLEMRATKPIAVGEQIFNTYGNPPNSDLLRRYSHVDEPNGNDIVELSTENMLQGALDCLFSKSKPREKVEDLKELLRKRLEWAFEFSLLDDTFILSYPFPPSDQEPYLTGTETEGKLTKKDYRKACRIDSEKEMGKISSELLQASRLLLMTDAEFEKAQKRMTLPKAEIDSTGTISSSSTSTEQDKKEVSIAELITFAIKNRRESYRESLEFDEKLLYGIGQVEECQRLQVSNESDEKKRKSLVVRVGEKRILRDNLLLFEFVKGEVDKEIEKKEKKKLKLDGKKRAASSKDEGMGNKRKKG